MKKVIILSCNTGQGHNSCARAIQEYFASKNVSCEICDALSFISKRFAKFISWGHSFMYRNFPGLFQWGYRFSKAHTALFHKDSRIYMLLTSGAERMYRHIVNGGYDTVIMCGSMGCGPIKSILKHLVRGLPEQAEVTVICGTNQRLYRQLNRRYGKDGLVHIVGYNGLRTSTAPMQDWNG